MIWKERLRTHTALWNESVYSRLQSHQHQDQEGIRESAEEEPTHDVTGKRQQKKEEDSNGDLEIVLTIVQKVYADGVAEGL